MPPPVEYFSNNHKLGVNTSRILPQYLHDYIIELGIDILAIFSPFFSVIFRNNLVNEGTDRNIH